MSHDLIVLEAGETHICLLRCPPPREPKPWPLGDEGLARLVEADSESPFWCVRRRAVPGDEVREARLLREPVGARAELERCESVGETDLPRVGVDGGCGDLERSASWT